MSLDSYIGFTDFVKLSGRSAMTVEKLLADELTPPLYFRGSTRWFSQADVDAWIQSGGLCRTSHEWETAKRHFSAADG